MDIRLTRAFLSQPAVKLAPLLLGKYICHYANNTIFRLRITETEAYAGESDTACHASKGKTPRTSVMYKQGGTAYIYLCYGIHHLLNVVAAKEDEPEAVLIRGVEGYAGPGRLTKAMGIDKSLNGIDLVTSDVLWLEEGNEFPYTVTPRIGINYASEEDKARLWRFLHKP